MRLRRDLHCQAQLPLLHAVPHVHLPVNLSAYRQHDRLYHPEVIKGRQSDRCHRHHSRGGNCHRTAHPWVPHLPYLPISHKKDYAGGIETYREGLGLREPVVQCGSSYHGPLRYHYGVGGAADYEKTGRDEEASGCASAITIAVESGVKQRSVFAPKQRNLMICIIYQFQMINCVSPLHFL